MTVRRTLGAAAVAAMVAAGAQAQQAKNVIVMISDGIGFNGWEAAKYYQGSLPYDNDTFHFYGCTTYQNNVYDASEGRVIDSKDEAASNFYDMGGDWTAVPQGYDPAQMWTDFNYHRGTDSGDYNKFTDSAAAATALYTGTKTFQNAVSFDVNGEDLKTFFEDAAEMGKATGSVSSVQLNHATPAAVDAHTDYRKNKDAIAHGMVTSDLDVIMGGDNYIDGSDYADHGNGGGTAGWEADAAAYGFTVINDASPAGTGWTALADGTFDGGMIPQKVAGVFTGDTLNGRDTPTLAQMTQGALRVLEQDEDGFCLMVEGGAVDWANHANDPAYMMQEQVDFDNSVQIVIDWIEANGGWDETLLIVTSDHECGGIWGPDTVTDFGEGGADSSYVQDGHLDDTVADIWTNVVDNGVGVMPGYQYTSTGHSNALVPLWAKGVGADKFAGLVDGRDSTAASFWDEFDGGMWDGRYVDNTDVAKVARMVMGVSVPTPKAKNVFLMISDGIGFNGWEAAKYYQGSLPYENAGFNFYGCTTYQNNVFDESEGRVLDSKDEAANNFYDMGGDWTAIPQGYDPAQMWTDFNYHRGTDSGDYNKFTDSAAAATALYTGTKTFQNAVSFDVNGEDLKTFFEDAAEMGKATGSVSSVQLNHATPAAVDAHTDYRKNKDAIAHGMVTSDLDVIMGGDDYINGSDYADHGNGGGTAGWEADAAAYGFTLINDASPAGTGWTALADGTFDGGMIPQKVAGVFTGDTLNGRDTPTLAHMTQGALRVLEQDEDGFCLMVEGGAVDWANHANDPAYMMQEQIDFDNSVQLVMDWIMENGGWEENLLIVTSDHECGGIWGPDTVTDFGVGGADSSYEQDGHLDDTVADTWTNVVDNGVGVMPGYQYTSTGHSNALVPLWAKGAGADLFDTLIDGSDPTAAAFWDEFDGGMWDGSYVDNTDVAMVARSAMGVATPEPTAKNVFLMISDGIGFNGWEAAKYYQGSLPYDNANFDFYGCTTYQNNVYDASEGRVIDSKDEAASNFYDMGGDWTAVAQGYDPAQMWTDFNYHRGTDSGDYNKFTDSAAAATALYTGTKTFQNAVSFDVNGNEIKTFFEDAAEMGKATGSVSSVQLNHATPAAVDAHTDYRKNKDAIAHGMVTSDLDVIMGGDDYINGSDYADHGNGGGTAGWEADAAAYGFAVINDASPAGTGWTALADGTFTGGIPQKVAGVFTGDTLSGRDTPTLAQMTQGALRVLEQDENGFCLMVEGGAVDWANHANDPAYMMQEQIDFDNSVQIVIDWIEANGGWDENLLIVTSDHECGGIWGPDTVTDFGEGGADSSYVQDGHLDDTVADVWTNVVDNGVGVMPGYQYTSTGHSNALVPLWVRGAGAAHFSSLVDGRDPIAADFWDEFDGGAWDGCYVDNTDVAVVARQAMGVSSMPPVVQSAPYGSIKNARPVLSWQPAANAEWYYVYLMKDGARYHDTWTQCSEYPINWDLPEASYTWYVMSWGSGQTNVWSTGMAFTVDFTDLPGAAYNLHPTGGVDVDDNLVSFSWSGTPCTQWYYLYLQRNGEFYKALWTRETELKDWQMLCEPGDYSWWVQSWSPAGYGEWSAEAGFMVSSAIDAPGKPMPVGPSGLIPQTMPVFSWTGDTDTQWTYLSVEKDGLYYYDIWLPAASTYATYWTFEPGNYTWSVTGWNEVIGMGETSTEGSFTVE